MSLPYKMGLIVPRHTIQAARAMVALHAHLAALGVPPSASYPWAAAVEKRQGGNAWMMDGNDQYGDCVIADDCHQMMALTANGAGPYVCPTRTQALAQYALETGFDPVTGAGDNGTDPTANATYLMSNGFLGHKLAGWGPIDIMNRNGIMWATHLFCGVKFCIQVPDFAFQGYQAGLWDYTDQPYNIEGGHDILGIQYHLDSNGAPIYDVITWGKRIQMTERFWQKFGLMAIAVVSPDELQKTGVTATNLNMQQMLSDLTGVEQ